MIGQPADSKNDHNYHHGLHKLGKQKQRVTPGPLGDGLSLLGQWEMLLLVCVCFALLKCRGWYISLRCYSKETNPGNGNWEQGTGRELERMFPGARSGLSAEELLAAASERCGGERQ